MEINKEQFRALIEEGEIGPALNQLSDIMHFLGDASLMDALDEASEKFNEYQEAEEGSAAGAEALQGVKTDLLSIVERLPDEFDAGEMVGEGPATGKGCAGVLLLLVAAASVMGYLMA